MKISFSTFFTVLLVLLLPVIVSAQVEVTGRVISEDDNTPIAYASIGIKNKEAGCVADSTGRFTLQLPPFVKSTDSLIISSIGFERSGFVVAKVKTVKEFRLKGNSQDLNNVIVKSHFKELKLGNAKEETFLFFRAWGAKGTGGEIGQIMEVPINSFSIHKVEIKIDNKYDTCWVRLHVRSVTSTGQPGEELLKENIIKPIFSTNSNDSITFELQGDDFEVSNNKIFVGFEVLDCRSGDGRLHSICFVGSEYGQHTFKPFANTKWDWDAMFSIHIKMTLKY
jgi:hypothetical protein